MFLITIESSPASLTVTVDDAADLPSRNLKQRSRKLKKTPNVSSCAREVGIFMSITNHYTKKN